MTALAYVLGSIALAGCALVAALFWFVRRPPERDEHGHVSTEWQTDQIRGRRQ
jgi:hypothetical protein